jgi:hypothetical protein
MAQAKTPPTTRSLLDAIEAFRQSNSMTKTRFGIEAANDPNLVDDLERGREPRWQTIQRINNFIEEGASK